MVPIFLTISSKPMPCSALGVRAENALVFRREESLLHVLEENERHDKRDAREHHGHAAGGASRRAAVRSYPLNTALVSLSEPRENEVRPCSGGGARLRKCAASIGVSVSETKPLTRD